MSEQPHEARSAATVEGNCMDASYVLDWLKQSGAPENIVALQEKVVEAAGGYIYRRRTMTVGRYDDNTWAVYDANGKVLASGFFTSQAAHDWIEAATWQGVKLCSQHLKVALRGELDLQRDVMRDAATDHGR